MPLTPISAFRPVQPQFGAKNAKRDVKIGHGIDKGHVSHAITFTPEEFPDGKALAEALRLVSEKENHRGKAPTQRYQLELHLPTDPYAPIQFKQLVYPYGKDNLALVQAKPPQSMEDYNNLLILLSNVPKYREADKEKLRAAVLASREEFPENSRGLIPKVNYDESLKQRNQP